MRVLFFASIAEYTETNEIYLDHVNDTEELKVILKQKYPGIEGFSYAMAVNKTMLTQNQKLNDDDEVALLPPFSGG